MKTLVFVAVVVAAWAVATTSASPLAMWVSGDLPAASSEDTAEWMVDAAASSPLPPPSAPLGPSGKPVKPVGKPASVAGAGTAASRGGSHQPRAALKKPIVVERRVGCSVTYDNAQYTFGGANGDTTHGALTNDISRFDQMLKTWELVRRNHNTSPEARDVPAAGAAPDSDAAAAEPCARYGHSCAVAGQRMVMYGGFNEHDDALSDLWAYNFLDKQWQQLNSPVPSAAAAVAAQPKPKAGAPAPPPPPKSAPVYAELSGPSEYGVHVVTPGGRGGHVSVVSNDAKTLWVFGGRNSRGEVLNDLFSYDLTAVQHGSGVWTAHLPPSDAAHVVVGANAPAVYPRPADRVASSGPFDNAVLWPGAREQHACVVDRADVMWCYGGVGYAADPKYFGTLSDVWSFPLGAVAQGNARWSCAGGSAHFAVNERPRYVTPEYVHHFENLPPQQRDSRYYRFRQQQNAGDDAIEATSLVAVDSHAARTAGKARASVLARARARTLPVTPGGRYSPLLTYDRAQNSVWLFGGRDSTHTALNDLWSLSLANRQWLPYHGLSNAAAPGARSVSGPLVWPPSYGGSYSYSAASLVPGGNSQQLYVYGSRPFTRANDVWQIDLFGRSAMAQGVDVCASNPCAHGGVCTHLPDVLLGGGVGYQCRCTTGYTGRHCQIGDHLYRHLNNPFVGGHAPYVPDFGDWKPIEEVTKPYPIVEAFVPPKVAPPAPPVPVTVGPAYVPSTETRTVQLWRDPNAPARELPVELAPNLASDPRIIRSAERDLKAATTTLDALHHKIRRIANAPLVERHYPPSPAATDAGGPAPAPAPVPSASAAPGVLQPMAAPLPRAAPAAPAPPAAAAVLAARV